MQNVDLLQQMNEYYSKRADFHDSLIGYRSSDDWERLNAPLIRRFDSYIEGRDVLEIACGTGNWTQVLSRRAGTVVATDVNSSVIEKALAKNYDDENVSFRVADAYALRSVKGKYTAAFAGDWWSHIPRSKITGFIRDLHRKLQPDSPVVFVDMMRSEGLNRMFSHYDDEGNLIHRRDLPGGEHYFVVKNFPTEDELREIFRDSVDDLQYYEHLALRRWMLTYRTKPSSGRIGSLAK